MVERAADGGSGARRFRHLRHLGGFAECALLRGALFIAVLLAVPRGKLRSRFGSVGGIVVESVAGIPNSMDSRRISRHLLLLSQSLLQVFFLIASGLRRAGRLEIL